MPFVLEYKQDVTPEGLVYPQGWSNNKKIVITVRLDTDGVAATRDSTDLIGKSIAEPIASSSSSSSSSSSDVEKGKWSPVEVELTDRGIGGKFVTRKK
jgi:translation elongation factor EF-Ts